MNKEKQIKTMACDMCTVIANCNDPYNPLPSCEAYQCAKRAAKKGYCKASEVVRDIFDDLNELWHKGRGFIDYSDLVRLERLHEQKYTEGEITQAVYKHRTPNGATYITAEPVSAESEDTE